MTRIEILTAQEHKLFGSGVIGLYRAQPHKPLAVIDRTLTVEACDKLRRENPESRAITSYYGVRGCFGNAQISPLDTDPSSKNYGCSLHDPILRTSDGTDFFRDNRPEFPWARDVPNVQL